MYIANLPQSTGEAVGPTTFLTWSEFLGSLYMQLANFRPDVALQIELAPYRERRDAWKATTGLCLCSGDMGTMSPGGHMR